MIGMGGNASGIGELGTQSYGGVGGFGAYGGTNGIDGSFGQGGDGGFADTGCFCPNQAYGNGGGGGGGSNYIPAGGTAENGYQVGNGVIIINW